jgi:4-hydroxybenzoate polyprenyltransferase
LLGYVTVNPSALLLPPTSMLLMYTGAWSWTLVYDTLYAHQDVKDDRIVGVRSTALLFGEQRTKPILSLFSLGFTACAGLSGVAAGIAGPIYCALVAGAGAHLLREIWTCDLKSPPACMRAFVRCARVGPLLLLAIAAGNLISWPSIYDT